MHKYISHIYRIILLSQLMFFTSTGFAQSRSGNLFEFLDLPTTSHSTAIGGNHAVMGSDDPGFSFQNPAMMRDSIAGSVALNFTPIRSGIKHGSAVYMWNVDPIDMTASIGVQYINYGSFDRIDEFGTELGTFKAQEVALYLSSARSFSTEFSLGMTLKPIFSKFEEYSSIGIAMDLGAYYRAINGRFRAGFILRNVGGQIKQFDDDEKAEHLSTDLGIGLVYKPEHAPFRLTLSMNDLLHWNLAIDRNRSIEFGDNVMRHTLIGLEMIPTKSFYIAMGYNHRMHKENRDSSIGGAAGFSWGFGINVANWGVSYGMGKYHKAGASNSITISTNLNRFF